MKVYIVQGRIDYEGFHILGVYSTKIGAERAKKTHQVLGYCDDYEISTHELQMLKLDESAAIRKSKESN